MSVSVVQGADAVDRVAALAVGTDEDGVDLDLLDLGILGGDDGDAPDGGPLRNWDLSYRGTSP